MHIKWQKIYQISLTVLGGKKLANLLMQAVALIKWHLQTVWQVAELCNSAALNSLPTHTKTDLYNIIEYHIMTVIKKSTYYTEVNASLIRSDQTVYNTLV
jgi:hypothetical protein